MKWVCRYCLFEENIFNKYYWRCPRCGEPLDIKYSSNQSSASLNMYSGNIWDKYAGMIPFIPEKTRGEGSTPLIVEKDGSNLVLFKLEYLNPSGSFKDRGSALAVYYGYKMGFKKVIEDTSGNTGISITLYSKLYGLKPLIVMPRNAPGGKKRAILNMGGEIIEVNNRDEASRLVQELARKEANTLFYVAHLWNPLYIICASTITYEVLEEFGVPDYVIVPVGSGGLILGLAKGFEKAMEIGMINRLPRMIAVQGYSVQPVHEAYKGFHLPGERSDLADGLMVANPPRLTEIINTLRAFKGDVFLIGNTEIRRATIDLWEQGFLVEPSSATAYAVYEKIKKELANSSILIVLTGSGLKML